MQILAELLRLRQICCDPSLCFPRYKGGSAKLETCMELLENGTRAGHKILLFSQFTSMLDVIAGRLSKEKIRFYMLTGATPKGRRMQMVSDFHKDDVMVFLISLKAGGTGLNLTAADVVIHYDPWWNAAARPGHGPGPPHGTGKPGDRIPAGHQPHSGGKYPEAAGKKKGSGGLGGH